MLASLDFVRNLIFWVFLTNAHFNFKITAFPVSRATYESGKEVLCSEVEVGLSLMGPGRVASVLQTFWAHFWSI